MMTEYFDDVLKAKYDRREANELLRQRKPC
jgi:hypothetical protein